MNRLLADMTQIATRCQVALILAPFPSISFKFHFLSRRHWKLTPPPPPFSPLLLPPPPPSSLWKNNHKIWSRWSHYLWWQLRFRFDWIWEWVVGGGWWVSGGRRKNLPSGARKKVPYCAPECCCGPPSAYLNQIQSNPIQSNQIRKNQFIRSNYHWRNSNIETFFFSSRVTSTDNRIEDQVVEIQRCQ